MNPSQRLHPNDVIDFAARIRQDRNREPKLDCGHSWRSLAKISGVGVVCMECDTGWEQITDPLDGPISLFRRKDGR